MSAPQSVEAEPIVKTPEEVLNIGVDFTVYGMTAAELLTGTPLVSVLPSGITLSAAAVNIATFINRKGQTVAIGKGVQFTASGGTVGTDYEIRCTCGTTLGQTHNPRLPVHVR